MLLRSIMACVGLAGCDLALGLEPPSGPDAPKPDAAVDSPGDPPIDGLPVCDGDNFDNGVLDPSRWTIVNTSSLITIAETQTRLVFTVPTGVDALNHLQAATLDLSSASIEVELVVVPPTTEPVVMQLIAVASVGNHYVIHVHQGYVVFQMVHNGVPMQAQNEYSTLDDHFVRIRNIGANVRFETSANGTIWMTRLEVPALVPLGALTPSLAVGTTSTTTSSFYVIYDNFQIVTPTCAAQ